MGGHIEGYNKYSRYDGHEKRVKKPPIGAILI